MSNTQKINWIGELINNSYARARNAWSTKDLKGFQNLAKIQTDLGAKYINVNIDGTQMIQVKQEEMLAFLPDLIPAIQEVTSVPLSFDNPAYKFHEVAFENYDFSKSGKPILNSLAASREELDPMIELIKEYDTLAILMASEKFTADGSAPCLSPEDAHATIRHFMELLRTKANRKNEDIIVDPGLAPVGADTYGLVNIGLDTMKLISQDPDLKGLHMSVGLSNFAWGIPKHIRLPLEKAYLALGYPLGLDYALANPEKEPQPLDANDPLVSQLRGALKQGRPLEGESQEDAGFRQAEYIMELCMVEEDD